MNKKSLLVIFIISLISVIYTINSICYKYIDKRIDNFILTKQAKVYTEAVNTPALNTVVIINEHTGLLITITVAAVIFAVVITANQFHSLLFLILFIIAYLIAYKIALDNQILINLTAPLASIAAASIFALTYKAVFKENVNKKIENILSKYISKDITDKVLKSDSARELGGKRAEITVMFADIRGFTSLSETRKAEEVSQLLNEYFSELEPIITKYNGVINKYIGDAVLVVFGDPTVDKFHAKNAVKCAYELRNRVKDIKQRWICEGKPKIDIGIGINTGEAFIGNVGTENRFEYTVIGDAVNIASRIEDYNKIYKTHILISENTYNKISQIVDVIKIREVTIKGKAQKINIYEVLRITE